MPENKKMDGIRLSKRTMPYPCGEKLNYSPQFCGEKSEYSPQSSYA